MTADGGEAVCGAFLIRSHDNGTGAVSQGTSAQRMQRHSQVRADISVADRLIEAAEELYGRHGLEGVSLRQLSIAAGTGNNYAVQYHFGGAAGLIRAILEKRVPEIELKMARLLAKTKAEGRLAETRSLVELLFGPLFEHVNSRGERAHARFILALLSSPEGAQHFTGLLDQMPIADHVFGLLHAAHPDIPPPFLRERQRLITILVLTSVFNRHAPYNEDEFDAALIDNALNMASAALTAPIGDAVRSMLRRTGTKRSGR
jgi:AcrR family transcriptional regulator